jgi:hypothetical protein
MRAGVELAGNVETLVPLDVVGNIGAAPAEEWGDAPDILMTK